MPHPSKSQLILVVEDDPSLRELYRSALSVEGYAVVAVEDGLDALRLLDGAILPAAVVLDLGLPRLRGRDVYQELKARTETRMIPILVVTGGDATDLDPADFACIIKKPVSIDALLDAIAQCIRQTRR